MLTLVTVATLLQLAIAATPSNEARSPQAEAAEEKDVNSSKVNPPSPGPRAVTKSILNIVNEPGGEAAPGDAAAAAEVGILSAVPASGSAPLSVQFTINGAGHYRIDFGDLKSTMINTINSQPWVSHTYIQPGVHLARLIDSSGQTVATIKIVVRA